MATIQVNAMGEPCPIPVVKATNALREMKEPGILEVLVDNDVAVQNLLRMASGKGLEARSEETGEKQFTVTIAVNAVLDAAQASDIPACAPQGDTVVVISSSGMGSGSDELGKTLMKAFIYALSQQEVLPRCILLYNGGAYVSTEGSASLEDLRHLQEQGVEILTCGTCLDFYGLKDKLAVGGITNMYSIVEKLNTAGRIVRP